MTNGSQIVINLQDSQIRVNELRRVLDQVNLVTDSKKMLRVFDGVKASLLEVVSSIDKIINFDPAKVEKNYAQAQSVQSLANQIQKNLFEGKMKINELPDDVDNLITEKSAANISELITSFLELQDLYETQIQEDHLSFERLALPEVESLFSPAAFAGLEKLNRSYVLTVLRDFLAIDSISPDFEQDSENYKTYVEKYFPIFTKLTKSLSDEVSLIANDLSKFDTVLVDAQQSRYLEAFRQKLASLLNDTDLSVTELIKATKDDAGYMRLIGRVLDKAFNDDSLSIVDLTKTLLTLQALRIKELEKTDRLADLQLLSDEKMLGFNDKRSAQDRLQFYATMVVLRQDTNPEEFQGAILEPKKSLDPLKAVRKALSADKDLKLTIAQLKKEFTDLKPQSEFSRFYEENKILFIKFAIEQKDLLNLKTGFDNTLLTEMLDKIKTKTIKDSSIRYEQAARFAYVLAQVFAKEPKIHISPDLTGKNLSTISFDNALLRIFKKILDNQNNLPKNPPEDHK